MRYYYRSVVRIAQSEFFRAWSDAAISSFYPDIGWIDIPTSRKLWPKSFRQTQAQGPDMGFSLFRLWWCRLRPISVGYCGRQLAYQDHIFYVLKNSGLYDKLISSFRLTFIPEFQYSYYLLTSIGECANSIKRLRFSLLHVSCLYHPSSQLHSFFTFWPGVNTTFIYFSKKGLRPIPNTTLPSLFLLSFYTNMYSVNIAIFAALWALQGVQAGLSSTSSSNIAIYWGVL